MNHAGHASKLVAEAFSDPNRSFIDAMCDLERRTDAAANVPKESTFEEGIRIKRIIDKHEDIAKNRPSLATLAVLLNCETRLWHMYSQTPIRYNPFLVHWVETLQRLENFQATEGQHDGAVNDNIAAMGIVQSRLECIRRLLSETDPAQLLHMVPLSIYQGCSENGRDVRRATDGFNIHTFIDILVEDGIIDRPSESGTHAVGKADGVADGQRGIHDDGKSQQQKVSTIETSGGRATTPPVTEVPPRITSAKQWRQEINQKLKNERDSTLQNLTRLPLELPFLDFLNELLDKQVLESHGIDPAPIITGYIQHSLRMIEKMGAPSSAAQQDVGGANENRGVAMDGETIWEYGKEAQSRAVILLLLFIKNLIRKNLLSPEILYFEIQEICIRYVWIKEVRDFRAWVEQGEERG